MAADKQSSSKCSEWGRCQKHPKGGPLIWGVQPTLDKNGGDNTFCPGMGGTWNFDLEWGGCILQLQKTSIPEARYQSHGLHLSFRIQYKTYWTPGEARCQEHIKLDIDIARNNHLKINSNHKGKERDTWVWSIACARVRTGHSQGISHWPYKPRNPPN